MSARKLAPHQRPLLDDTTPEARLALGRVYQQMSPERKAAVADNLVLAWMRHTLEPDLYEKARSVRDEYQRRRVERGAQVGAIVDLTSMQYG